MDPNATLGRFRDAIKAGELAEAESAADDLTRWVRSGGFLPTHYATPAGVVRSLAYELGRARRALSLCGA